MDENNVDNEWAGLDCEMCECIHGHKAPATKHSSKKCPVCKTAKIPQTCEYEKHACPNCVCCCNPCKRERARDTQPPEKGSADPSEEGESKIQELPKKEATTANDLEEAMSKNQELLDAAATCTTQLEEAHSKTQELMKDDTTTAAALEEVMDTNQKLRKEAAATVAALEDAMTKNADLLKLVADIATKAVALELAQASNKKLLEEAAVEPTELNELIKKNQELQEEADIRTTQLEKARSKNQELLKKEAATANDLEEVLARNQELLDAAAIRTTQLEEAHSKTQELMKDDTIRAAALEEVMDKNQKLREHAASKKIELEKEKRQHAELLKNADIEWQARVKHLANILRVSTEYVNQNFEDVTPLEGNDKDGQANSVGYLHFAEPIEVIIDDAKNTTVDLYTVVIGKGDGDFESAVYGQMFGAHFFVGATTNSDEPSGTFYFANFKSPMTVISVTMDLFMSDWVPKQLMLRGKLDIDQRQAKAMEAIANKFFKKPSGDKKAQSEDSQRKSARTCPRLVTPGRFGAAVGDGQFTSPAEDGDNEETESDSSMKVTPLRVYKVGFRKGLCVAYKPESSSPVVGILIEETEKHSRVRLKTANGATRTYDMKNLDVIPPHHPLYAEYNSDLRKYEIEENERLARKRDDDYKNSLKAFVSESIIQAKNEMTDAVQKLLPPLPPKKKATPASPAPEIPADKPQDVTTAMIKATVAEALKAVLPPNRTPTCSYRYSERPDARRSASRSPSPRHRSPEYKPARSYRYSERPDARRSASRSPSPRRRSPEYKPARSYHHEERPDARRSACSPDSSPSPERRSRKRASLQYSPNASRDSKYRRR